MSATIANAGPMVGGVAQGLVQGRQLATQEDTARQGIALRAAEEGRQKEQHRLNIQALGLQIQRDQQIMEQASQMFPSQLERSKRGNRPLQQVDPSFMESMLKNGPSGFSLTGQETGEEAQFLYGQATAGQRAKDVNAVRMAGQDDALQRTMLTLSAQAKRSEFERLSMSYENAVNKYQQSVEEYGPEHQVTKQAELQVQNASKTRASARNAYNEYVRQFGPSTGYTLEPIPEDELEPPL